MVPSEVPANDGPTDEEDRRSPSPRQASFSTNDCPMNYSDDINSSSQSILGVNCMSPISLDEEDERNQQRKSICSLGPSLDAVENRMRECESKSKGVQSEDAAVVNSHSCRTNATSDHALLESSARFSSLFYLIEKGADANMQDSYGRTALHLVCENNEPDCLAYILGKGTADVNIQDMAGRTPLHIAARQGSVKCIRNLLAGGARTDIRDSKGDTPLHRLLSGNRNGQVGKNFSSLNIQPDNESHSSLESASSLLLGRDGMSSDFIGSFYQTPRGSFRISRDRSRPDTHVAVSTDDQPGVLPCNDPREALRKQNDSGYFTASGSAWIKNKYYNKEKIEEESTVSQESEGHSSLESAPSSLLLSHSRLNARDEIESDCSSRKTKCANDLAKGTRIFDCLEFMLRVVLYLLHSLLMWSTQQKKDAKPGDPNYQFVKPPDHVAEAMERLVQLNQQCTDKPK